MFPRFLHTFSAMIKPLLNGKQVRRKSWRKGRSIGFVFTAEYPAIYDQDGVFIYDLRPDDAKATDWVVVDKS